MATKPSRTDTVGKIKVTIKQVIHPPTGERRWHVYDPYHAWMNASYPMNAYREALSYAQLLVKDHSSHNGTWARVHS